MRYARKHPFTACVDDEVEYQDWDDEYNYDVMDYYDDEG